MHVMHRKFVINFAKNATNLLETNKQAHYIWKNKETILKICKNKDFEVNLIDRGAIVDI